MRGTKSVSERLGAVEEQLGIVQMELSNLRSEFDKSCIEHQETRDLLVAVKDDLHDILGFVSGTSKVFGFARKHWRTAIAFGAGLFTTLGVGNPELWAFLKNFFAV